MIQRSRVQALLPGLGNNFLNINIIMPPLQLGLLGVGLYIPRYSHVKMKVKGNKVMSLPTGIVTVTCNWILLVVNRFGIDFIKYNAILTEITSSRVSALCSFSVNYT